MLKLTQTTLDNKSTPLKVPGFHGLPVNVLLAQDEFATGTNEWHAAILTAKELAMLKLINAITDRPGWHRDIFDQRVVTQWREDAAVSSSLINDKTWDWCLKELQDKAQEYDRDGQSVVFNTHSGVCKSDTAISSVLKSQLSNSADLLSHRAVRDKSAPAVINLVEPSLYPLVFGRTKVISSGQSCGMDEHSWLSRSEEGPVVSETPQVAKDALKWPWGKSKHIWSSKFQWLPCEVEFTGPSGSTDVQISSYINNIHPTNREMYSAVESVISASIKQWNKGVVRNRLRQVQSKYHVSHPREPVRIHTYGVEWKTEFPEWAKTLPRMEDESKLSVEEYESMCAQVEAYIQQPNSKDEVFWPMLKTRHIPEDWKVRWGLLRTALNKYACTFVFEHSDPGTSYSYADWKAGRTQNAIVGPPHNDHVCRPDFKRSQFMEENPWLVHLEWMYMPKEEGYTNHEFYTVALQDEFRQQGLQVVVRVHGIELDPETPSFAGEEWHTEGNANEHIVANSIYALSSENISEPQISFRQRCRLGGPWVYDRIGPWDSNEDSDDDDPALYFKNSHWDLKYIEMLLGRENIQSSPALQELGEVKMPAGRLISFPNAFQSRMGPLQLEDKTKPGHCRFLTFSLVDPTYRLCSTRNVLPQQFDWMTGDGVGSIPPMDATEALELREELVKEHAKKEEGVPELAGTLYFSGYS
ncbi:hypothetical protein N7508_006105 [Penicillium antarcticum]|uniref:uncharacterized protein n=1 Tax=Penicillium antarcticum TaxID=416450 RepID=UPI00238DBEFA|nr:uncharacterized protein N7508_006105 [Penicillium antarcticum]KAJ5301242.1 hypothetical protein N7508_006105 [Penicillium antarcticum]